MKKISISLFSIALTLLLNTSSLTATNTDIDSLICDPFPTDRGSLYRLNITTDGPGQVRRIIQQSGGISITDRTRTSLLNAGVYERSCVKLDALPDEGKVFIGWDGYLSGTTTPILLAQSGMPSEDVTISAKFDKCYEESPDTVHYDSLTDLEEKMFSFAKNEADDGLSISATGEVGALGVKMEDGGYCVKFIDAGGEASVVITADEVVEFTEPYYDNLPNEDDKLDVIFYHTHDYNSDTREGSYIGRTYNADGSTTNPPGTIPSVGDFNANHTMHAIFDKYFNLTEKVFSSAGNGWIFDNNTGDTINPTLEQALNSAVQEIKQESMTKGNRTLPMAADVQRVINFAVEQYKELGLTLTPFGDQYTINQYIINVQSLGNGSGTVSANPSGWPGGLYDESTVVTLTATADEGSSFTSWIGCDSVSGKSNEICKITVNSDKIITANFEKDAPPKDDYESRESNEAPEARFAPGDMELDKEGLNQELIKKQEVLIQELLKKIEALNLQIENMKKAEETSSTETIRKDTEPMRRDVTAPRTKSSPSRTEPMRRDVTAPRTKSSPSRVVEDDYLSRELNEFSETIFKPSSTHTPNTTLYDAQMFNMLKELVSQTQELVDVLKVVR